MIERDVLDALKAGKVPPVLLLVGDDEVGKTALMDALSNLVEPDLKPFNLQRIYANERPVEEIVAAARTLPFLGERRVIFALRCETFLKPKGKAAAREDEADSAASEKGEADTGATGATAELSRYLSSPSPENVLVLVAADMARNTKIAKQLLKTTTVVEYWGLKSDRDARGQDIAQALYAGERFVRDTVRDAGLRIRPDAIGPLLEHAGTDITVLRNDLERLVTYCAGRMEITIEDARAVVGGAVQVDEWAMTRAIQAGDAREALKQLDLGLEAGQSPWMILGQLAWFVRSRLAPQSPGRARAAVDAVFQADIAIKSSGGDPQVLLERLVVELCGSGGRRGGTGRQEWRR